MKSVNASQTANEKTTEPQNKLNGWKQRAKNKVLIAEEKESRRKTKNSQKSGFLAVVKVSVCMQPLITMNFDLNQNDSDPRFSSDIGYLFLLDKLIQYANGYGLEEDWKSYLNCLEQWYLETIYRFQKAATGTNKFIKQEDIEKLNNLRKKARNYCTENNIKNYHEKLNELTHKANLRLKDRENTLGILEEY